MLAEQVGLNLTLVETPDKTSHFKADMYNCDFIAFFLIQPVPFEFGNK